MSNGLAAERKVAAHLREAGFLVSSRRHFGGAGDILAIQQPGLPLTWKPLLVEVKATTRGPFAGFPPEDRWELSETAATYGCEALLAWVVSKGIAYLTESEWP